jgi:ectoine hydroxylase-related dioxygenase (phytanoyl-CoA dioxygenase family)
MSAAQNWHLGTGLQLPRPTRDRSQALADIEHFGLAIIEEAMAPQEIDGVRNRIVEQAAAEREAGVASLEHEGANQRVWNLINKGQIFAEILQKPLIREMMTHILGGSFTISSYTANIAGRGGEEMMLHSDQGYVPLEIDIPLVANIMWMLDDFTGENGATRVVPGSHRARRHPEAIDRSAAVPATGPAGTALVFDGRLWHGTGRNLTERPRHGLLTYFSRPFIRPQENCTLSVADDVLASASPWLKELLGFRVWRTLGGVEGPYGRGTVDPATINRKSEDPDPSFDFLGGFVERPGDPIREMRPTVPTGE